MTANTQIVLLKAEDGFSLYGAWYAPANAQTALLLIHGFCSNFYRTPLRDVAEYLAARGYASLVLNTRGHDRLANTEGPQPAEGSYVERISESPRDINTGLNWLRGQGYSRLLLGGHSLGALKSIHYLANNPSLDIRGLISCSCPFWGFTESAERIRTLQKAREMHAEGRSYELIYDNDGNVLGSPAMILDRAENYEAFKPQPNAGRITCRALYLAGDAEPESFRQTAEECKQTGGEHATMKIIAGADHVYTDREQEVAQAVEAWLAQL